MHKWLSEIFIALVVLSACAACAPDVYVARRRVSADVDAHARPRRHALAHSETAPHAHYWPGGYTGGLADLHGD